MAVDMVFVVNLWEMMRPNVFAAAAIDVGGTS